MDQLLIDSIRKNLEDKSTEEIRQAIERGNSSGKSQEEFEAMRLILNERARQGTRFSLAVGSAVVLGTLAAGGAWWQVGRLMCMFCWPGSSEPCWDLRHGTSPT
jgi:hypothetical protein